MRHESRADLSPRPGVGTSDDPPPRPGPERFAGLFVDHAPELKRYVVRRLGLEPADDIVAETFAVALQRLESYDGRRGDERAWLYGIATNLIGRHRRREIGLYKALSRTGADAVIEPFTDEVEQRVVADGARRRLAKALAGLSRKHRDTLLLVTWAELTYEEAAVALGVPVGTVRSRVNRARSSLRRMLAGIDPTVADEG
ncbi:RNA polymerase sigma-70 factor (ECF subfamily) [Nonomuraea thailandensis]|uniref:RNA polymerase sigma-70 factor (ECF subfamily) n=1 Tax=Nonomuraea thailandensis TaxID=1188745 RepID=A0A9X2GQR6_9ACTN|nr:RNA polymerase sigma factor [Nonomuraea thailandensis]MCP2361684.1 RNA polymerase sigma-70 factor (ECF subfamily) [Nonomuraea thailandensis]